MKRRITFELEQDDPLYLFLMEYVKTHYTTLSGVIRLALQKMLNEEKETL